MLGSSTDVLLVLTRSESDVRVYNALSLGSGANTKSRTRIWVLIRIRS